jgi:hypothetical protein
VVLSRSNLTRLKCVLLTRVGADSTLVRPRLIARARKLVDGLELSIFGSFRPLGNLAALTTGRFVITLVHAPLNRSDLTLRSTSQRSKPLSEEIPMLLNSLRLRVLRTMEKT